MASHACRIVLVLSLNAALVGCGGSVAIDEGPVTVANTGGAPGATARGTGGRSVDQPAAPSSPADPSSPTNTEPVGGADCPTQVTPTVVVPSGVQGMHIAVTDTHVYWATSSTIMRRSKSDGSTETVAEDVNGRAPFIDGNRLYWGSGSQNTEVYGLTLDGKATPQLLLSGLTNIDGWAVSNGVLYGVLAEGGMSTLMSVSATTGGTPDDFLAGSMDNADAFAADATGVYWYDDLRAAQGNAFVRKYSMEYSAGSLIASADAVQFLRTGGGHVVWANAPSTGNADTIVWSEATGGATLRTLGAAPLVRQLATDATNAYWAASSVGDDYSDIVTAPLDGGPSTKIACHVWALYSMAVDDTDVYFSTWDTTGTLSKVPKRVAQP